MHSWITGKVKVILFYSGMNWKHLHQKWVLAAGALCSPVSFPDVVLAAESLPLGRNSCSSSLNSSSCTKHRLRHSWNGFSLCTVYPRECQRHLDIYPKPASMQMAPRSNSLPLTYELICFHISISLLDTLTYLSPQTGHIYNNLSFKIGLRKWHYY